MDATPTAKTRPQAGVRLMPTRAICSRSPRCLKAARPHDGPWKIADLPSSRKGTLARRSGRPAGQVDEPDWAGLHRRRAWPKAEVVGAPRCKSALLCAQPRSPPCSRTWLARMARERAQAARAPCLPATIWLSVICKLIGFGTHRDPFCGHVSRPVFDVLHCRRAPDRSVAQMVLIVAEGTDHP